jgi:signal recognition particle subunit SRP54
MLRMMKRLGPMKKVLGLLPGMGELAQQVGDGDRKLNRVEALLCSMTPRERLRPEILDMSRRRRVARGAGQDVGAVHELLKSHRVMGQMMKQMGRLGLGAQLGAKQKLDTLQREGAAAAGGRFGLGGSGSLAGLDPSLGLGGPGAFAGLGRPSGGAAGPGGAAGFGRGGLPGRHAGSKKKKEKRRKRR